MRYGRAFWDPFTLENLTSQKIRHVMGKINCVNDPDLETEFPRKWKSTRHNGS
jgi:2-methylcitrate dehydratase PrpD